MLTPPPAAVVSDFFSLCSLYSQQSVFLANETDGGGLIFSEWDGRDATARMSYAGREGFHLRDQKNELGQFRYMLAHTNNL